jgi:5-methylcytosine-specific restriction endonuclease McrA
LYRNLGYASIHQYAELALGFKKSKTSQFLRLSESLKALPELRRTMAAGELSWTKAREVAKVATPETEAVWIREAKQANSRALEARVMETRRRARVAGSAVRGQGELIVQAASSGSAALGSESSGAVLPGTVSSGSASANSTSGSALSDSSPPAVSPQTLAPSVPMDVHLRMTPEQYARYQALIETIRKRGRREDRTELVLAALEQMALGCSEQSSRLSAIASPAAPRSLRNTDGIPDQGGPAPSAPGAAGFTHVNSRSPYQVIVQQCPDCGSGRVATNRGDRKLAPQELRAILCDAHKRMPGKTNRAAVPDRLRRAVLQRDRFRCRSAGCSSTSFLAVHHLVPRERGGGNALENLITLCSGCHRALHARE